MPEHKDKPQNIGKVNNNGQTVIHNYSQALKIFWRQLYGYGGKTLYSLQRFGPYKPDWINVEHVFPMAWVVKDLKCRDRRDCRRKSKIFNYIESDLHNLFPSRRDLNMLRGSYGFGSIKGEVRLWGKYQFQIDHKRRIIEPHPVSQGEIARAMFYMTDSYDLRLFKKQAKRLYYWNHIDPPSSEERYRNDLIETLQDTRNRFIDFPDNVQQVKTV